MRGTLAALLALFAPGVALAQPTPNLGAASAISISISDGAGNSQPVLSWYNNAGPAVRQVVNLDIGGMSTPNLLHNNIETTLSASTNSSVIWLQDSSHITANGPGVISGELNLQHSLFKSSANANTGAVNAHESSTVVLGTMGLHTGYLGIYDNGATGITTSANVVRGQLTNDNPAAGSVGTWAVVDCEAKIGAGSAATNNYCIRNGDPNSDIATVGHVAVGTLSHLGALLQVNGPDTSSGTLPFAIRNSAGFIFIVDDSGVVNAVTQIKSPSAVFTGPDTSSATVPLLVKSSTSNVLLADDSGVVTVPSTFKSATVILTGVDNTGSTFPLIVRNQSNATSMSIDNTGVTNVPVAFRTGSVTINGLDNAAGTLGLQVRNLAGTSAFSINNAGGISANGIAGANCAAGTVSATTMVVTNGIVTHC
jgi:hypothetical protein